MWREALKQLASDIDPILDFPLDLAATTWFAVESRARRLGRRVTRIPDANLDWPTALKVLLSASGDDVEGCLLGLLAALDAAAESKHIVDGRVRTCTVHLDGATARVQMWFKPPSMLGRWRRGQWDLAQQAGVRPMRYPDLVTEQLQHLGFAAVRHLSTQIEPRLSDLQTGRSLAIALCPLLTGCHTHFVAKDAGPEGVFWARPSAPLSAPARLAQHLEAMGEWLAAEERTSPCCPSSPSRATGSRSWTAGSMCRARSSSSSWVGASISSTAPAATTG